MNESVVTLAHRQALVEQGYVVLPGIVPDEVIDAALRKINAAIGDRLDTTGTKEPVAGSVMSDCPELMTDEALYATVVRSPAWAAVEELAGPGAMTISPACQIALRFPLPSDGPEVPIRPHIDAYGSGNNGVAPGTIFRFALLVHVLLSDLPSPGAGNFTMWPGSHRLLEAYYREHGAETLANGLPPIDLGEPVELTGRRGDVLISHYQLGHAVGRNTSPHIRYGLFFRVFAADHLERIRSAGKNAVTEPRDLLPFSDLWLEWPGMQPYLSASDEVRV